MSLTNTTVGKRFKVGRELSDTLQGCVYIGYDKKNNNEEVILKEAWRKLVSSKKSRNGHLIDENILNERLIQKYLSSLDDCDPSICKCISIWDDDSSVWSALEKCQYELLNYVQKSFDDDNECDILIQNAQSMIQVCLEKPNDWIKNIQILFKQLAKGLNYLHTKNICHNDISLENLMLNIDEKTGEMQAKFIDFGLAKMFVRTLDDHKDNDDEDTMFICKRKVGKIQYMSPEMYNDKKYDARANDIYCLGVCLFCMLLGSPPYTKPERSDVLFSHIMDGHLQYILQSWKRMPLLTKDALDLLERMLCKEKNRIKMKDILNHPFLKVEESKKSKNNNIDEIESLNKTESVEDVQPLSDDEDFGLDDEKYCSDVCGLDSDSENENEHNEDTQIMEIIKQRENEIRKQMELKENNDEENKPKLNKKSSPKMRRLAKIKLEDWGFLKYEANLVKHGFCKLSNFNDLDIHTLTNVCKFTKKDAVLFVKKFCQYKGVGLDEIKTSTDLTKSFDGKE